MFYSDWSLFGGSETYRRAKAGGAVDVGGKQLMLNDDRAWVTVGEKNGVMGHYEPYNYEENGVVVISYRFVEAQQGPGDPIPGAELINQYEQNEILGWGYIFAGQVLIENGAGGKYITKLRNALIEAPMFNVNRNLRLVNNILNVTVQAVKTAKEFVPANEVSNIYFSAVGASLGVKGEMLLFENSMLAPKIREVNPRWYNDNIAPISSYKKFGGAGASEGW